MAEFNDKRAIEQRTIAIQNVLVMANMHSCTDTVSLAVLSSDLSCRVTETRSESVQAEANLLTTPLSAADSSFPQMRTFFRGPGAANHERCRENDRLVVRGHWSLSDRSSIDCGYAALPCLDTDILRFPVANEHMHCFPPLIIATLVDRDMWYFMPDAIFWTPRRKLFDHQVSCHHLPESAMFSTLPGPVSLSMASRTASGIAPLDPHR